MATTRAAAVLAACLSVAHAFQTSGLNRAFAPRFTRRTALSMVDTTEITMPALSSTMTEGKIVQWLKGVGDKVEAGDAIMVVESDKADMDVEAFEEGYIAKIITPEGEMAAVGAAVALLAETEDQIAAVAAGGAPAAGGAAAPAAAAPAPAAAAPAAAAPAPAAAPVNSGVIAATPMAKQLAKSKGVDVTTIKGTGNFGRVTEDDVLIHLGMPPKKAPPAPPAAAPAPAAAAPAAASKPAAAAAPAGPAPTGVVPMTGMQKGVAKNMEKTLTTPIFRVSRVITTDKFDALYAKVKPKGVSVSALLAKAVAMCLEKHPIVNAAYDESGAIKYNDDINVCMAVALNGGLITPTIRKCNELDIYSVGREWRELVGKAKEGTLKPDEYTTGTFAITNLGMFGVSSFEAILPAGMGSILAIGGTKPTVVPTPSGHFGVEKQMTVTITCDHRHIYGADAAEFLKDLGNLLENDTDSLLF